MNEYFRTFYSISIIIIMKISRKYPVNPLYPALKRLPFSGFQSSLIAGRRGSAIRPAIETLQKANRSCGRVRMATSTVDHGFTEYLPSDMPLAAFGPVRLEVNGGGLAAFRKSSLPSADTSKSRYLQCLKSFKLPFSASLRGKCFSPHFPQTENGPVCVRLARTSRRGFDSFCHTC